MPRKTIGVPGRRMNPALAAITVQHRDSKLINAAGKANMILTLTVLHDKFGFGGKERLPKFIDEYGKLLEAYNTGYINVADLEAVLKVECGIEVTL